jgi:hypothetical protein
MEAGQALPVPPHEGAGADPFERYLAAQCTYRLVPHGAADSAWAASCGGAGTVQCTPLDVLVRAWCTREWQVCTRALAAAAGAR